MTIRARRTILVGTLGLFAVAASAGCHNAQSTIRNQYKMGTSEPARVRAQTPEQQAAHANATQLAHAQQPRQRTLLVANDNLGGRIFPDVALPASTANNTAIANVPASGE
ncbi:MAG: hypothetical protein KF768_02260 [Phycisphaeraceae bacterium]|nr:hypothetical protein [Phycisphaeraceae bacterium]